MAIELKSSVEARDAEIIERIWREFEDFAEGRCSFVSRVSHLSEEYKMGYTRVRNIFLSQLPAGSAEFEFWESAPKVARKEVEIISARLQDIFDRLDPNCHDRGRSLLRIAKDLGVSGSSVKIVFENYFDESQKDFWQGFRPKKESIVEITPDEEKPEEVVKLSSRSTLFKLYIEEKKRQFLAQEILQLPSYEEIALDVSKDKEKPISRERVRQLMVRALGKEGVAEWQTLRHVKIELPAREIPLEAKNLIISFVENQYRLFWEAKTDEIYSDEILVELFGNQYTLEEIESVITSSLDPVLVCRRAKMLRANREGALTLIRGVVIAIQKEITDFQSGVAKVKCPMEIRRQFTSLNQTDVYRWGKEFMPDRQWDLYLSLPKTRIIRNPSKKKKKTYSGWSMKYYPKIYGAISEILLEFKSGQIGILPGFTKIAEIVGDKCTKEIVEKFFACKFTNQEYRTNRDEYLLFMSTNKPVRPSRPKVIPRNFVPVAV